MCNVIVDVLWPAEAQTMANMKHLHLLTATYLIHGSQEYFEHRKNVQLVALPRLFWEKHIWNYVSYNSQLTTLQFLNDLAYMQKFRPSV